MINLGINAVAPEEGACNVPLYSQRSYHYVWLVDLGRTTPEFSCENGSPALLRLFKGYFRGNVTIRHAKQSVFITNIRRLRLSSFIHLLWCPAPLRRLRGVWLYRIGLKL